tara:strand:- start:180 stop:1601 length:1422 start_codon:yes stop_codon:yes gene_type:complete
MRSTVLITIIIYSLSGCSNSFTKKTDVQNLIKPNEWKDLPSEFDLNTKQSNWWKSFNNEKLNVLIKKSLQNNWDLRTTWANLKKAEAITISSGAPKKPQIVTDSQAKRSVTDTPLINSTTNLFTIAPSISWEADFWGKLENYEKASILDAKATKFDLSSTALLLTANVTSTWIEILKNQQLLNLLEDQIAISKTLLDLVEARFSQGLGSALQVLQQRQQLIAVKIKKPSAKRALESSKNKLAILIGESPSISFETLASNLPELPEFPTVIDGKALFSQRPDLQSLALRVEAQDHRLASAIASKLPDIRLSLTWGFSASQISSLFESIAANVLGSSSYSLIDGGAKQSEIIQAEAQLEEAISLLASAFLNALEEIQTSITYEKLFVEEISQTKEQINLAKANLNEAKSRYINGLIEYLEVINAIQTLQSLERALVSLKSSALTNRISLYKGLGGHWVDSIKKPAPLVQTTKNKG